MKPIEFEGSNCVFAKDQPEYLPLPAYQSKGIEGEVVSCWRLSWKERIKILFGNPIFISVWAFHKPLQPQRPSLDNPVLQGDDFDEARINVAKECLKRGEIVTGKLYKNGKFEINE